MKKASSIILSFLLCFGLCLNTHAEDVDDSGIPGTTQTLTEEHVAEEMTETELDEESKKTQTVETEVSTEDSNEKDESVEEKKTDVEEAQNKESLTTDDGDVNQIPAVEQSFLEEGTKDNGIDSDSTGVVANKTSTTMPLNLEDEVRSNKEITAETTILSTGTYVLKEDVTLTGALTVESGANVTVNLSGHKLTLNQTETTTISGGAKVSFFNGSIEALKMAGPTTAVFGVTTGSSITLDDVDLSTNGSALYPSGNAASVTVQNGSVITAGTYAVATNAATVDNYHVIITLKDSQFSCPNAVNNDNATVVINVPGTLNIDNCTITGDRQSLLVRSGVATVTNSKIINTGKYRGDREPQYTDGNWQSGNEVPDGAVVYGNGKNAGAYNKADSSLIMTNTTIESRGKSPAVYIYEGEGDGSEEYKREITLSGNMSVIGAVTSENVITNVTGGEYTSNVSEYVDDALVGVEVNDKYIYGDKAQSHIDSNPGSITVVNGTDITVPEGTTVTNATDGPIVVNGWDVATNETVSIVDLTPDTIITANNGWIDMDGNDAVPEQHEDMNLLSLSDTAIGGYYTGSKFTQDLTDDVLAIRMPIYLDFAEYENGNLFAAEAVIKNDANLYANEWRVSGIFDGTKFTFTIDGHPEAGYIEVSESGVYQIQWTITCQNNITKGQITMLDKQGNQIAAFDKQTIETQVGYSGDPVRFGFLWSFGRDVDGNSGYQFDTPLKIYVSDVQKEEHESKTENAVSTWDDGGPFTTDAAGNVYDRWGNEIWHNPVSSSTDKPVSGFHLVNTSDR